MPTTKEIKMAKTAMLKHLSDQAKATRAQIDADKAADKRLADAAPELLAACKYVLANTDDQELYGDLIDRCSAAVAKAEGK